MSESKEHQQIRYCVPVELLILHSPRGLAAGWAANVKSAPLGPPHLESLLVSSRGEMVHAAEPVRILARQTQSRHLSLEPGSSANDIDRTCSEGLQRSRVVAGLLSLIAPGVGHLYIGR